MTINMFQHATAVASGILDGSYLWSNGGNWTEGVPSDGANVGAPVVGVDDINGLTLSGLFLSGSGSGVNVYADSLTVGTLSVEANSFFLAETGLISGSVSVTLNAVSGAGATLEAVGTGSVVLDNGATDPGEDYIAMQSGLLELAATPSSSSAFEYSSAATIALAAPASTNASAIGDLAPGDVLELPGNSVSSVVVNAGNMTITTSAGSYAFTDLVGQQTITGGVANHDSGTGLEAITFVDGTLFQQNTAQATGAIAGDYAWSNAGNWTGGVPADGSTVSTAVEGFDDIAGLTLASLALSGEDGDVQVVANTLTVGTLAPQTNSGLVADSEEFGTPVTVTVNGVTGSATPGRLSASGAGAVLIDNAATDPGEIYSGESGGLVELAATPGNGSYLFFDSTFPGTIALENPASINHLLVDGLGPGQVLEVPGNSVDSVVLGTGGLTIVTSAGSYAFTRLEGQLPIGGYSAAHDGITGLEAITFGSVDTFQQVTAMNAGALSGQYVWSNGSNWTSGVVPIGGASVNTAAIGFDDIGALSLASLTLEPNGQVEVVGSSLDVTTVAGTTDGALHAGTTIAGGSSGAISVTVGTITGSGAEYGAIGAGAEFIDQSASDAGDIYFAEDGGLTELSAQPAAGSALQYLGTTPATIALADPAASNAVPLQDVAPGDVLELPGSSVSSVVLGTGSLTIATSAGSYAFTDVAQATPIEGYSASSDSTTGLEAIRFSAVDTFQQVTHPDSGRLNGQFLWSESANWTDGVPGAGASVGAGVDGFDDIDGLSLASLTLDPNGQVEVVGDLLDVTTVAGTAEGALYAGGPAFGGGISGVAKIVVGTITGTGATYGAISAGSEIIDQSATDPGEEYYAQNGGMIELLAQPADGSTLFWYPGGAPSTIALADPAASNAVPLDDVAHGDVLEVPGNSVSSVVYGADSLTIATDDGTYAFTDVDYFFTPTGHQAAHDSNTGLEAVTIACYREGTRIRTPLGEVPIEALRIGDRVVTQGGIARPVKWIGRRGYDSGAVAANPCLRPVRIRAGALGGGLPRRDLFVSPEHALFFEAGVAGGRLVPAIALVNGTSILRCPEHAPVRYFHVELDTHAVIFAEGAAAESFLDCASRRLFDNAAEYVERYGDDADANKGFCAPRVDQGFGLEALRCRLGAGVPARAPPGLLHGHIERIAGGMVEGWAFDAANPGAPVELEIIAGARPPSRILANRYRGDLERAGLAGGRCAFRLRFSEAIGGIEIRRAADRAVLPRAA